MWNLFLIFSEYTRLYVYIHIRRLCASHTSHTLSSCTAYKFTFGCVAVLLNKLMNDNSSIWIYVCVHVHFQLHLTFMKLSEHWIYLRIYHSKCCLFYFLTFDFILFSNICIFEFSASNLPKINQIYVKDKNFSFLCRIVLSNPFTSFFLWI